MMVRPYVFCGSMGVNLRIMLILRAVWKTVVLFWRLQPVTENAET